jgi:hypothetical protein
MPMIDLRKLASAALLALALIAGTFAATPAQAQPGFGFGFSFGDDDDDGIFFNRCVIRLTDRALRNRIEDQGYEDVYLNAPRGRYIQSRATRGDWVYLLEVDRCTGDVVDRERLRRAENSDDDEEEDEDDED